MTAYDYAIKEIGTFEWAEGSNPQVIKYFKGAGSNISDDSVPWCAAFVGWCITQTGGKGTGKLNARSYLDWGINVDDDVQEGDVGIKKRGTSSWQGHVGFVVRVTDTSVWMVGGNQSDAVNISRYKRKEFLGFRRSTLARNKNIWTIIIEFITSLLKGIKK